MGQACCQENPKQVAEVQRIMNRNSPAHSGGPLGNSHDSFDGNQSITSNQFCKFPKLQKNYKEESKQECLRMDSGLFEPLEANRKCSGLEKNTLSTISFLASGNQMKPGIGESRLLTDMDTVDSPELKLYRISDNRKHSLQLRNIHQGQDDQLSCLSEGHESIMSKQLNLTIEVELPQPKVLSEVSGSCTSLSHHSDLEDIPGLMQNLSPAKQKPDWRTIGPKSRQSSANSSFEEYQGVEPEDPLKELKQKCFGNLLSTKDVVKWVLITQGISECAPELTKGIYNFVYNYHGSFCQKPGFWSEHEFRYFLIEANQQGVLIDSVSLLDS